MEPKIVEKEDVEGEEVSDEEVDEKVYAHKSMVLTLEDVNASPILTKERTEDITYVLLDKTNTEQEKERKASLPDMRPPWAKNIASFLGKFTIEQIDDELILKNATLNIKWLSKGCSLREALRFLKDHNISGAPVFSDSECLGFLELFDITKFVVQHSRKSFYELFLDGHSNLLDVEVTKAIDFEKKKGTSYFLVNRSFYGNTLVEHFAQGHWRVGVYSGVSLTSVISQTAFIQFIADNLDSVDNLKGTVKDLLFPLIFSCSTEDFAGLVYSAMIHHSINAVAVLKNGRFIGELTTQDCINFNDSSLQILGLSVGEFMDRDLNLNRAVTCKSKVSITKLIKLFSSQKTHRIWVVEHSKLVGLVTLTSFFKFLQKGTIHSEEHKVVNVCDTK